MKYFYITIIGLFLISCNNNSTQETDKKNQVKTLDEIINDNLAKHSSNDTIFLNFVLSSSKENTEKHLTELVSQNKIESKSSERVSIFNVLGYPYTLQFNDTDSCRTVISDTYFDNKLYTMTLFTIGGCSADKLLEFLTKVYGQPSFEETKNESYSNEKVDYWIDGNKQIALTDGSLTTIEYTDLRLKKLEIEKLAKDSIEQKKENSKKAAKAKTDFK